MLKINVEVDDMLYMVYVIDARERVNLSFMCFRNVDSNGVLVFRWRIKCDKPFLNRYILLEPLRI